MITKLNKHDSHNIKIFQTRNNFIHSYALRCCDCNKHIQWLSVRDMKILQDHGIQVENEKYVTGEV